MRTVVLKVEGMHCAACALRVEKALRAVPGVSEAAVDLPAARATVFFDDAVSDLAALTTAVAAAGYEAELAD